MKIQFASSSLVVPFIQKLLERGLNELPTLYVSSGLVVSLISYPFIHCGSLGYEAKFGVRASLRPPWLFHQLPVMSISIGTG